MSKQKKKQSRRKKEILRAQAKSSLRGIDISEELDAKEIGKIAKNTPLSYRLNMRIIKRDLLKTLIFLVVVVSFLIYLKSQGFSFNQVLFLRQ